MKYITVAFIAFILFSTPWIIENSPGVLKVVDRGYQYVEENLASAIIHKPVTVSDLQKRYEKPPQKQIRILVVPGHEPNYGGTEFGGVKERDLNLELADYLIDFLKNNGHYEAVMSRDKDGWNPVLSDYFKNNWDQIVSFLKSSKDDELHIVRTKKTTKSSTRVYHNSAPPNVAYRLYGINKWGNENKIDIAIHIHFNDNPRNNTSRVGKYSGFAIYVPEHIYANSTTTRIVADNVFKRLERYNPVSDLPNEDSGVIEEPALIAIGAYNTADAASMLIEYGYIYEPQILDEKVRSSTLKDLAFQTYLGLQDFFGSGNDVSYAYDTLMLPHSWKNTFGEKNAEKQDVIALQSALILNGVYPPKGKDKNDCPRTGTMGPCTKAAISAFQKKYGIKEEEGMVGEKTKYILNEKYSIQSI